MKESPKFRIIQVFNRYLQPGGEEKSVARMAEDLEAGGHLVIRFWRESAEWTGPHAPSKLRQPALILSNPPVLEQLRRIHARERADLWLLHNVLPVISLGIYRLARELNVPIVQWLHNYRPFSPSGTLYAGNTALCPDDPHIALKETLAGSWNGRVATAILSLGYRRIRRRGDFESVRAWVAVSEQMRGIFEQAGWYVDRLYSLRHSWHAQPAPTSGGDEGYFLFLGRVVETKGIRFLLELWRDPALRSIPLIIAGQGPLRDELEPHSPSNVRWVGHVEGKAKQDLKSGCRAIVFPSIWPEPLSTVAYEAYEMNKPILTSNLGGMPEVVQDGQTGFVLPAGSKAAWRDAIVRLSGDASLSRKLGIAGRAWLEREVSPPRWVEKFNAIMNRAGICTRHSDPGVPCVA